LTGSVAYGYDAADNLIKLTDAAGQTTGYQYDPLNRLSIVTTPSTDTATYNWEANGLPSSVDYPNGDDTGVWVRYGQPADVGGQYDGGW
jgi:YD repeat-containing protein